MNLNKKVILITGGSSGIGKSLAEKAKEKGAEVIITGRNQEKLDKTAKELGVVSYSFDVSKEDEVIEFYDKFNNDFSSLDALINNAGYGYFDLLENIDAAKFNEVHSTNVFGAMLMAREAAKIFKKQNSGNIINISSTAGKKGFAYGTPYVATKFALKGMTECWQAELRPYNVRVVLINPSEVQTDFSINAGNGVREFNPTKLIADDISHAVISALEMEDRGFITELTVFATNPKDKK